MGSVPCAESEEIWDGRHALSAGIYGIGATVPSRHAQLILRLLNNINSTYAHLTLTNGAVAFGPAASVLIPEPVHHTGLFSHNI